jgi:hypothetical protein
MSSLSTLYYNIYFLSFSGLHQLDELFHQPPRPSPRPPLYEREYLPKHAKDDAKDHKRSFRVGSRGTVDETRRVRTKRQKQL